MNRKLMELAEKYVAQRKRRIRLLKTVTALALVVAICTSYVLMMPGPDDGGGDVLRAGGAYPHGGLPMWTS